MAPRIPKGYGRYNVPYKELSEGRSPSLADLGNAKPAPWLPVYLEEPVHDDPVVIPAGTWIGRLNVADHTGAATVATDTGAGFIVPACASTGEYTLTYTALDTANTTLGRIGTPDVDLYPAIVAGAKTSTMTLPPVKPLGITRYDFIGSHQAAQYSNYNRQHMVTFLAWGGMVEIPVLTATEATIEAGDWVCIDSNSHSATTWNPTAAANVVGRIKPYVDGADDPEMKVGRCMEKVLIAVQSSGSDGQTYDAGYAASNALAIHDYRGLKNVQTVPGLGLQGSGTGGVPGHLLHARARDGVWWALKINVGCV